ncbi:hypothetical protein M0802_013241 [Mischocyttarus mexicanus]|nr:hypothetical protein M0802_013241 [Mischocyttarus mexicanus]
MSYGRRDLKTRPHSYGSTPLTVDINMLSFINQHIANKNNCRSIYFDTDDKDKIALFLSDLDNFLSEENFRSKVLIIFCRSASFGKLLKTCQSLDKWIGEIDIILWLAVVDELSFCRYNFGLHDCKIDTEFIFTFIGDPLLMAYSSLISNDCNTAEKIRSELIIFKEEIKLTPRSIAFMYVSYVRVEDELYELDTSIFKEVFPTVDLYPLYGTRSFYLKPPDLATAAQVSRIGNVNVSLWLAIVDKLSFCRYNFGQHDCRIDTEFIFMFISNPSLKSYTFFIPDGCNTMARIRRRLIRFKKRVELSLHSIAFMHVSYVRVEDELYELDTSIFKEVFPTVDLFPFYGTGSFVGTGFFDLLTKSRWPYLEFLQEKTTILLLCRD